jgi:hypothetical protein
MHDKYRNDYRNDVKVRKPKAQQPAGRRLTGVRAMQCTTAASDGCCAACKETDEAVELTRKAVAFAKEEFILSDKIEKSLLLLLNEVADERKVMLTSVQDMLEECASDSPNITNVSDLLDTLMEVLSALVTRSRSDIQKVKEKRIISVKRHDTMLAYFNNSELFPKNSQDVNCAAAEKGYPKGQRPGASNSVKTTRKPGSSMSSGAIIDVDSASPSTDTEMGSVEKRRGEGNPTHLDPVALVTLINETNAQINNALTSDTEICRNVREFQDAMKGMAAELAGSDVHRDFKEEKQNGRPGRTSESDLAGDQARFQQLCSKFDMTLRLAGPNPHTNPQTTAAESCADVDRASEQSSDQRDVAGGTHACTRELVDASAKKTASNADSLSEEGQLREKLELANAKIRALEDDAAVKKVCNTYYPLISKLMHDLYFHHHHRLLHHHRNTL